MPKPEAKPDSKGGKLHLVTQADDQTWGFRCPHRSGCGRDGVPFTSTGWPLKRHAQERGQQHLDEHAGHGPMPELDDYRQAQGLTEPAGPTPNDWVL